MSDIFEQVAITTRGALVANCPQSTLRPGLNERVQRVTLSEIAGTPRRPSKPPALSPLGAHGRSNAVSSQCRRDRSVCTSICG
jgi:hypothetical protein